MDPASDNEPEFLTEDEEETIFSEPIADTYEMLPTAQSLALRLRKEGIES